MRPMVTIMSDDSPKDVLRKSLGITLTPSLLGSAVELKIERRKVIAEYPQRIYNIPFFVSSAVFPLLMSIPAMPQLKTIHLSRIFIPKAYLHAILLSPHLTHLILEAVQVPKIRLFWVPKLRKLTLSDFFSFWADFRPLVAQLATSLEYLEFQGCRFAPECDRRGHPQYPSPLELPSFPCLRELNLPMGRWFRIFPDDDRLNELLHVGPHLTHLRIDAYYNFKITAFPKSLRHLSIDDGVLRNADSGINRLPQLISLSIRCPQPRVVNLDDLLRHPPFIRDHFPRITSLQLDIPWLLRDFALRTAAFQPKLQALKLFINDPSPEEDTPGYRWFFNRGWSPKDLVIQDAPLPAALRTLELEVIQGPHPLEWTLARCTQWIDNDILPPVTGLGGPNLKDIDLSIFQPEGNLVRKRVLCRRWVKYPNDDWQIEE
jgi:hypothetical protein